MIPKIGEPKAEEGGEYHMFSEAHKIGLQGQETGRLCRESIIRLRQRGYCSTDAFGSRGVCKSATLEARDVRVGRHEAPVWRSVTKDNSE